MSYSVKTWKKKTQTNSKNMKCHSTGLSKLFTWCYQCRKVRYDASLFSRFSCPSKRHIRPLCTDNIQEKVVVIYIKLLSISLSLYYPFSFLCVILCVFTFWVRCCGVCYDFRIKLFPVRLYIQLFVGELISYLRYLCLFVHSGVQYIYRIFVFICFSSSCVPYVPSFSGLSIIDCPFDIL
jgi:hypothetical protein